MTCPSALPAFGKLSRADAVRDAGMDFCSLRSSVLLTDGIRKFKLEERYYTF